MTQIRDDITIRQELEEAARSQPDRVYLIFEDVPVTVAEMNRRVNRLANGMAELGLKRGDRVAVMLPNHPDHFYAFLACIKLGVIQVPVNAHLRGASLEYLIEHAEPRALIADTIYAEQLLPALARTNCEIVIWRNGTAQVPKAKVLAFDDVMRSGHDGPPPGDPKAGDTISLSYTSGTTGPPKGVQVTDKMFRASAWAASIVADLKSKDVCFLWEPLFHIGGSQMIVAAIEHDVTIALVERFSATRFWDQVNHYKATQVHYLGGILSILLKQPPRPDDGKSTARVAWGGGAPPNVWQAFVERFKVEVRENYGMSECSSITLANTDGTFGRVGKPLPYFEVRIADEEGKPLGPDQMGEIVVREKSPGYIMKGYFRNPEATGRALRDGWMYTGDLGSYDEKGYFRFLGRKKDAIRRRGENVSAWEVERVLGEHPSVAECAIVGVDAEMGEQEIKAFVRPMDGAKPDPLELIKWCEKRLAYFQVPRYVAFVDSFAKTATDRIQKEKLSKKSDDSWDLEASGYKLARR
ncbi:MAG: AMP-binding protein [Alphaproteobacteria bacterium]